MFYLVVGGKVNFILNGNAFVIEDNELFVVPPNCTVVFDAASGPASVYWVSFWGAVPKTYLDLSNLNVKTPVFKCANDTIRTYIETLVNECEPEKHSGSAKAIGYLYLVFSALLASQNRKLTDRQKMKLEYADKAIAFIRENYMNNIGVKEISNHVSLERTYFSTLFKSAIGISPVEYLIKYRIDQAVVYMMNPLLSISEIATLVGFSDLVSFSVRFKAVALQSPTEYRKKTMRTPAPYVASAFKDEQNR